MKLSIVVPCYNEEENIDRLTEGFVNVYDVLKKKLDFELLLVNNGSVDKTEEKILTACRKYNWVHLVKVDINQGYGFGIKEGMKNACGDFIGWIHADLQTPLSSVIEASEIILSEKENENIFVKGERMGRSFWDSFFTKGMALFEKIYLKTSMYDINGMPNVVSKKMYSEMNHIPNDFSLDLYVYYFAKKNGYRIRRFKVEQQVRQGGQSSWNKGFASRLKGATWVLGWSKKIKELG